MLDNSVISLATGYWAAEFGCDAGALFAEPLRIVHHRNSFADYHGVFGLFRQGAAIVSVPSHQAGLLHPLLTEVAHDRSPAALGSALQSVATSIIGPAYLGYSLSVTAPVHPTRVLTLQDFPAWQKLQRSCDPTEWEHGGSVLAPDQGDSSTVNPCSGVFIDGLLAAVAGYETWGGTIAHISVVTHPGFRRRGLARSAVAHLCGHAMAAGLLPQYRTLESNMASLRVAESLGFSPYARSLAVRLKPSL
ncbi:MAG: GNAT family N-acetyltransferase [Chthoniobacter sp.]|nr:GNAT family N-acetyltransferase [Chthoniobacter sp.]